MPCQTAGCLQLQAPCTHGASITVVILQHVCTPLGANGLILNVCLGILGHLYTECAADQKTVTIACLNSKGDHAYIIHRTVADMVTNLLVVLLLVLQRIL